jgi:hypothetical protein
VTNIIRILKKKKKWRENGCSFQKCEKDRQKVQFYQMGERKWIPIELAGVQNREMIGIDHKCCVCWDKTTNKHFIVGNWNRKFEGILAETGQEMKEVSISYDRAQILAMQNPGIASISKIDYSISNLHNTISWYEDLLFDCKRTEIGEKRPRNRENEWKYRKKYVLQHSASNNRCNNVGKMAKSTGNLPQKGPILDKWPRIGTFCEKCPDGDCLNRKTCRTGRSGRRRALRRGLKSVRLFYKVGKCHALEIRSPVDSPQIPKGEGEVPENQHTLNGEMQNPLRENQHTSNGEVQNPLRESQYTPNGGEMLNPLRGKPYGETADPITTPVDSPQIPNGEEGEVHIREQGEKFTEAGSLPGRYLKQLFCFLCCRTHIESGILQACFVNLFLPFFPNVNFILFSILPKFCPPDVKFLRRLSNNNKMLENTVSKIRKSFKNSEIQLDTPMGRHPYGEISSPIRGEVKTPIGQTNPIREEVKTQIGEDDIVLKI